MARTTCSICPKCHPARLSRYTDKDDVKRGENFTFIIYQEREKVFPDIMALEKACEAVREREVHINIRDLWQSEHLRGERRPFSQQLEKDVSGC